MCQYCLADVIQEHPGRGMRGLNGRENRHAQILERSIHLTMRPSERIDSGNLVFVRELIKRSARNIKLHYVDGVWEKRDWVLF
jgi:hypothetical protein